MTNIGELPYFEIEVDKSGNLIDSQSLSNILAFLKLRSEQDHAVNIQALRARLAISANLLGRAEDEGR